MKDFIKSIYYRFRTSIMFNHSVDYGYDLVLRKYMQKPIDRIDKLSFARTIVYFKDGTSFQFWDENRYYAWLQDGYFIQNDKFLSYNQCRPTVETIYRFSKIIHGNEKLTEKVKSTREAVKFLNDFN